MALTFEQETIRLKEKLLRMAKQAEASVNQGSVTTPNSASRPSNSVRSWSTIGPSAG